MAPWNAIPIKGSGAGLKGRRSSSGHREARTHGRKVGSRTSHRSGTLGCCSAMRSACHGLRPSLFRPHLFPVSVNRDSAPKSLQMLRLSGSVRLRRDRRSRSSLFLPFCHGVEAKPKRLPRRAETPDRGERRKKRRLSSHRAGASRGRRPELRAQTAQQGREGTEW